MGDPDPVGILLAVLSLPLWLLEWVAATLLALVRPSRTVTARQNSNPPRRLTWKLQSVAAAKTKVEEIAERLRRGDVAGVDADADSRRVG